MKRPLNLALDDTPRQRGLDAAEAEAGMTLGREAALRINALEGLTPTKAMLERIAEADREGLTPDERLAKIVSAYAAEADRA